MAKPDTSHVLVLLQEHFSLNGKIKDLPGEEDYNYYFRSEDNKEYTVKVSRPDTDIANLLFQGAVLKHLSKKSIGLKLPEIIHTKSGEGIVFLENKSFLRLQKWVPGKMLSEARYRSPELLQSWGATCGLFSKALEDFDHPTAHRFYKWNPSETLYSRTKFREFIKDEQQLEVADYFWNLFETTALPHLPKLRKSVNYNDAHEHNLLITQKDFNTRVHGVIDFGDALYTETINELAIACAYAGMRIADPLEAMSQVVWGYHQMYPIREEELEVLFPLIAARLMITAASSAYNKVQEPENEYLLISEKPAWDLLNKLSEIPPNFAKFTFRKTCGLVPCKKEDYFNYWIKSAKDSFAPIIDFQNKKYTSLDLSVGSLSLGHNTNFDSNNAFTKTIKRILAEADAAIGIGGYLEARPVYTTDAYAEKGNYGRRWRTIHLGIDVWTKADTPVHAPLDGIVHSFQDNDQDRDYGPTIVLQHQINEQF
ncbi:MAG: phosphotransferase, partial [Saprospiraceae bacterium]